MQGLWPRNVMLWWLSSEEQSQPAAGFALSQPLSWKPGWGEPRSAHPQLWGACHSAVSICISVLLVKHHSSPSAVEQHRGWSSLQGPQGWVVGELWEGAPPAHPWAGSAQRWETRRQPARNPGRGGRELSQLCSALLLAGKCAFKARLTKEAQENKMQIRGEINFRRVSFVMMTQLFRGRQSGFGSIKGMSLYPLMNSFLSVPLDMWGGHRFARHQSCLPRHLPVAVTKANKIQKSSCCFFHSAGYWCLVSRWWIWWDAVSVCAHRYSTTCTLHLLCFSVSKYKHGASVTPLSQEQAITCFGQWKFPLILPAYYTGQRNC